MTTPTAQPAAPELIALVAAARPDLDPAVIEQIVTGAMHTGRRSWAWILTQTVLMVARGEDARDLRAALDDPLGLRPRPEGPR